LQQHPAYKFHTATRHTAFFGLAGVLRRALTAGGHAVGSSRACAQQRSKCPHSRSG
jgi:hypothetical protein